MTVVPRISTTTEPSLGLGMLSAARFYLGSRWALLALAGLAVITGLYFGGWGWLVAAGLAPIILSLLPCAVMCGFSVCMMCRSNKSQSAASLGAADLSISSAADRPDGRAQAAADTSAAYGLSCCQGETHGNPANALAENAGAAEKEKPHA